MAFFRAGLVLLLLLLPHTGLAGTTFDLMVQTHFSQGWNTRAFEQVREIGARTVRDGVYWRKVETVPGQYDMSSIAPYHAAAKAAGVDVLLIFQGRNLAYDGGRTPYTDTGRKAFARFVAEVTAAFPDTVKTIEIGNEYNTESFVKGPMLDDPGRYYGLLIQAVVAEIRSRNLDVTILCTGAHSVATGYFRKVFENGALDYCDGISFHPYRETPAYLDAEIGHLKALMQESGKVIPLHVTEFGKWFNDPSEAPDFMLKMVALMGAAGVESASWYALLEQEMWPNMGLYRTRDEEMPAAAAFRFLRGTLLPLGRPVARGEIGEDRIYEFGEGGRAFVVWGSPAQIETSGPARFFDSSGRPLSSVPTLSARPVVIMGTGLEITLRRDRPAFDAVLGHGKAPWSYLAKAPGHPEEPLQVMEWNWDPYFGLPSLHQVKATPVFLAGTFVDGIPYHAVERYTAPKSGEYAIEGRWFRKDGDTDFSDGADIRISLNGRVLARGVVAGEAFSWEEPALILREGDTLDFAVGPNGVPGGDYARREITIIGPP